MPSLDVLADLLDESCLRDASLQDMVHVWLPFIKTTNRSYPIDLKDPIPSILRNRASTWVVQGFATHKHKLVVWRALPLPFNSAAFSSCLYVASGMASIQYVPKLQSVDLLKFVPFRSQDLKVQLTIWATLVEKSENGPCTYFKSSIWRLILQPQTSQASMASHQLNGITWAASIITAGVTINGSCFPVRQPHNAPHGGFHKWGYPKMWWKILLNWMI